MISEKEPQISQKVYRGGFAIALAFGVVAAYALYREVHDTAYEWSLRIFIAALVVGLFIGTKSGGKS